MPKRFDTFFFIAAAPEEQQAAHDQLETTAGVWITPAAALEQHGKGDFPLVFATIRQLEGLMDVTSVVEAEQRFQQQEIPAIRPRAALRDGEVIIRLPGEVGYEELA